MEAKMTRKEITGIRDLSFSGWIRENLPDSKTGFMATDVDFFLFNYKKRTVSIIEVKTYGSHIKTWQQKFYNNLHQWIREGVKYNGWNYKGFYFIQFENTCFDDGWCKINHKKVTENEAVKILSQ
jgi:hypothetical protein